MVIGSFPVGSCSPAQSCERRAGECAPAAAHMRVVRFLLVKQVSGVVTVCPVILEPERQHSLPAAVFIRTVLVWLTERGVQMAGILVVVMIVVVVLMFPGDPPTDSSLYIPLQIPVAQTTPRDSGASLAAVILILILLITLFGLLRPMFG